MPNDLKEYIVSLKNFDDLESFYEDMETPGGNLYIPNRAVDLASRRPTSRNTHYMLTAEEANSLKNDPRVYDVELTPDEAGMIILPGWTQTSSNWAKSTAASSTHLNWGILRCYEGVNRPGWGADATQLQSGTVNISGSGKNVDVVIMDGHMDPNHPEFAANADGTGGSRVSQINWFTYKNYVNPSQVSNTYVYSPYVDPAYADDDGDGISDRTTDNNHGSHVASTACGNTLGWARDANFYNISPYSTNPNTYAGFSAYTHDYIRWAHILKPVNPNLGFKSPTIVNSSWGQYYVVPYTDITQIIFRGVTYTAPFTKAEVISYGIYVDSNDNAYVTTRISSYDIDINDCISYGIIYVASAMNNYAKIANVGDQDYNNNVIITGKNGGAPIYYNRGSSPSVSSNVICVGAIRSNTGSPPGADGKANFSNTGPRITIWAPGANIQGAVMTNTSAAADSRNGAYYLAKYSGTSMAAPQVTGLLACWLETNPRATQTEAIAFLQATGVANQIPATTGGITDYYDLQGAPNLYLAYQAQRQPTGNVYPKSNLKIRPSSGQTWPRPRIFRYGS